MALLIIAFLVSLIPAIALYLWLKNHMVGSDAYRGDCKRALLYGALATLPVLLTTGTLRLVWALLKLDQINPILDAAYKTIISLALAEELCKYFMFGKVLQKGDRPYSWLEMTALMTIVGIGFGLLEDVVYAFSTNAIQMIVRGITVGHGTYGFVMGYFMGKGRAAGDKKWSVLGFVIPWAMHGLYDFGLSEVLSDYFLPGFISIALAVADLVLLVVLIRFMRKARNDETYTTPIPQSASCE